MKRTERFLDRRGRIVVERVGLPGPALHDVYLTLLRTSWPRLIGLLCALYFLLVGAFALLLWLDRDGIAGGRPGSMADAFNLSVQTFATIGYGVLSPRSGWAHGVVAFEAFIGMLAVAITTGLAFAKFSRPTARVVFSRHVVVGSFDGRPTLMLRLANARESNVVEAQVHVTLVRDEHTVEGRTMRRFHDLPLVRSWTPVFALTFTAMHLIVEESPFYGATPESLAASNTELVVTLVGLDETLSHTLHARAAYGAEDIAWNASFRDVIEVTAGRRRVNYTHMHEVDREPVAARGDVD